MKTVTVYHVDYVKRVKTPVGAVLERRRKDRPGNLAGLLHIARKTFSSTPQEAFQLALDKNILSGS